ncbi:MAG TPA: hypothetical protein ENH57_01870 [Actinobacteria bacterium]|nr:hypothetical protein [Actinomycetota bacterium]
MFEGGSLDTKQIHFPLLVTMLIAMMLIHEFGHVVASFNFGLKPRFLGLGIYMFQPIIFTDTSDAWELKRGQRVVSDMAGIYFQLILGAVLSAWMLFFGVNLTLLIVSVINIAAIVLNLDPFLRSDGYWAVTDYIGINNAHEKTFSYVKNLMFRKILRKETNFQMPKLKPAARKFFIGYSFLYTFSIAFFTSLGVLYLFAVLKSSALNKNIDLMKSAYSQGNFADLGAAFTGLVIGQLVPLLFLGLIIIRIVKYMIKTIKKR